ncbi:hypothetical protein ACEPAG_2652 [Sanghuangporus baumii]
MVATRQMTKARAAKQGSSSAAVAALVQAGASKTAGPSTSIVTRRGARRGAANNQASAQGEGSSAPTPYDVKEAEESASTASLSNSKGGKKGSTRSSGPAQTTTTTTQTCGLYLEVKIEHISASVSGHSGASSLPPPKKTRQPRKAPGTKKAPAKGGKSKANTKKGKAAEKTAAVPDNETVMTGSKRCREDAEDETEGQPETSGQGARRTRRKIEPVADQEIEPVVRRTRSRKAVSTAEPPKPRASRRKAQASRTEPAPPKSQVTRKEVPSHDDITEVEAKARKNKGKGKAVDLPSSEVASVGSKRRRDEEDVDVEDVSEQSMDPGPSRRTTRRTRQKVEQPAKSESSTEVTKPSGRRAAKTKAADKGKGKAKAETPEPTEPKRDSPEPEEQVGRRSPGATGPALVKQESRYSSPVPVTEESTSDSNGKVSSSAVCKKEEPSSSPLRLLLTAMDYSEREDAAIVPPDIHTPSQAEPTPTLPVDGPSSAASKPKLSTPTLTLKPEESMLILAPRCVLPESAMRGTYNGDVSSEVGSDADDSADSLSAVTPAWSGFSSIFRQAVANMGSFAAASHAQQGSGGPTRTSPASINAVQKSGARERVVAADRVSSVIPGDRSEKEERSPTSSSEVSEMLQDDDVRLDSEDDETSPCRTSGVLTDVSHKSFTRLAQPSRRSLTILPASPKQPDAGSSSMALVLYNKGSSETETGTKTPKAGPSLLLELPERTPSPAPSDVSFPSDSFGLHSDDEVEIEWTGRLEPAPEPPTPPKAGPSRLPDRTPPSPAPSDVSFPSDSFGLHSDDEVEIEWTGGPEPAPEPPTPPPIRAARAARPSVAPQSAPTLTPSSSKCPAGPSQTDNCEEDNDRVFHTEEEVPPELRKAYRFARHAFAFSYLRGGVREKTLLDLKKRVYGLDSRFTAGR